MLSYGTALGEQLEVIEAQLNCCCPLCKQHWKGPLLLTLGGHMPTIVIALCVTCAEKHLEAIAVQTGPFITVVDKALGH